MDIEPFRILFPYLFYVHGIKEMTPHFNDNFCNFCLIAFLRVQFSSVQSLSRVQLFAIPWTAVRQASCPSPALRTYSNSCSMHFEGSLAIDLSILFKFSKTALVSLILSSDFLYTLSFISILIFNCSFPGLL